MAKSNFFSRSSRLGQKLFFQAIITTLEVKKFCSENATKFGLGFDWKKPANFSQNGLKLVCTTNKHCNIETFVSLGAYSIDIGPIFKCWQPFKGLKPRVFQPVFK